MNRIFCLDKEKAATRYEYRTRGLTLPGRKRHSSRSLAKMLKILNELQSFQLGPSHFRQRREKFMALAPLHFTHLAKSQNTGATGAVLAAENGATSQELMPLLGWKTL